MTEYRKLTQAELLAEATKRFGPDPMDIAFRCPNCGDVATVREWDALGEAYAAGQACIGRATGALKKPKPRNERGCDWSAGGLIRGPWEIVIPSSPGLPERSVWGFPLADAPVPERAS
jgi:hypothetical protein